MTSLQSISGSLLYYLIGIISILLMIGQTAELFQAIRYKREKKHLIVSLINSLLCFALLIVMMDFAMTRFISPEDEWKFQEFEWALFALPWLWIVCGELISAAV